MCAVLVLTVGVLLTSLYCLYACFTAKVKVKVRIALYGLETHHRATERHLPHGITQCYLPPDTGERATPQPEPCRPVPDLPTPEGWKAELTLVVGYIPRWFTCPQTVTRPSTNHLIATRPGVEPTTSGSPVQRPNRYTTKPPQYE